MVPGEKTMPAWFWVAACFEPPLCDQILPNIGKIPGTLAARYRFV
jgi:hypothetical protein